MRVQSPRTSPSLCKTMSVSEQRALLGALSAESKKRLRTLLENVAKTPSEPKFRSLRTGNRWMAPLLQQRPFAKLMRAAGWVTAEVVGADGAPVEMISLPMEADLGPLQRILDMYSAPAAARGTPSRSPESDLVVELAERATGSDGAEGELLLYAAAPSASLVCPICFQVSRRRDFHSATPRLPVAGVSIVMERERQENDSLVNGYSRCWRTHTRSRPTTTARAPTAPTSSASAAC